jgi:hypothetical protein
MYIYFFERILRAVSGDPNLALPYWNYSDPAQRALPVPFREPSGAANPLFVSQRNAGINAGAELLGSDVSTTQMHRPPRSPAAQHRSRESRGWMGDPNTAAQDPIF